MLRLEDVHAGYPGHPVLHGVHLELDDGQRLAILGRNGAGKTTLLRVVIGALKIREGRLSLDGADLGARPAHRRAVAGIAYVPQGRGVFAGMSVRDNLRVAAVALRGREWRPPVEAMLDTFPLLRERERTRADSLSGGQQQLLVLARALLCEPRILLLDEPTEGIQPSILDDLAVRVLGASEERGMSVLVAEQNLEFAARLADRALIVEKGRISADLPTDELRHSRELQRRHLAV